MHVATGIVFTIAAVRAISATIAISISILLAADTLRNRRHQTGYIRQLLGNRLWVHLLVILTQTGFFLIAINTILTPGPFLPAGQHTAVINGIAVVFIQNCLLAATIVNAVGNHAALVWVGAEQATISGETARLTGRMNEPRSK